MWHSHDFLLPCIAKKEKYIISPTFIIVLYNMLSENPLCMTNESIFLSLAFLYVFKMYSELLKNLPLQQAPPVAE